MQTSTAPAPRAPTHWPVLAGLSLLVIVTFLLRLRLVDLPLERDEGEYAYGGQLLLQGIVPWSTGLLYNMKLPGTYAMYALGMALLGQTIPAIKLLLLATDAVCTVLLWTILARLMNVRAALVGAIAYSVLILGSPVLGTAAHATHFVNLWALFGFLLLVCGAPSQRAAWAWLLGGGVALGMSVLMKQSGATNALFAAAALLVYDLRARARWTRVLARQIVLNVGVILPYAVTVGIVYQQGVAETFWFWTIDYLRAYGGKLSLADAIDNLRRAIGAFMAVEWLLMLLVIAGVLTAFVRVRRDPTSWLLVGLVIASAVGVSAGFHFRPHYFVAAVPVMAGLVAYLFTRRPRFLPGRPEREQWQVLWAVLVFAVAQAIYTQRGMLFRDGHYAVLEQLYAPVQHDAFMAAVVASDYVRQHTDPDDRILAYGNEPELLFYAQRRNAVGYIYLYPLCEGHRYADAMHAQYEAEMRAAGPKMVVLCAVGMGPAHDAEEAHLRRRLSPYWQAGYELVATVVVQDRQAHLIETPAVSPRPPMAFILRRKG